MIESNEAYSQPTAIDPTILKIWGIGVILMLLFGWLNYTINSRLTPAEAFAETFPITTTACLIPDEAP